MKRTKVRALSSRSSPDKVEDRIRVRVKVKVKVKDRAKVRAKAMSNGVATPEVNSRMKVKTKSNVNSNSSQRKIRELFVLKPNNNWYVIFSVYGLLSYREWLIKPPGYS